MITSKQAARLRHRLKKDGRLPVEKQRQLDEYEAAKDQPRPTGDPAPQEDRPGGEPQPGPAPDPAAAPASDPVDPGPMPNVEPPPRVADAPTPKQEERSKGKASGDWRDRWRDHMHFSGDGRATLCEGFGDAITEGLGALCDEMRKAGIEPRIDPRVPFVKAMYVLALDELLPERARLTPKIGAAVATVTVIGQRYYYAEQIAEYLKKDPEHQEWLRKQAEREKAERKHAEAHADEVKKAEAAAAEAKPSEPKFADAPVDAVKPEAVNGTAIMVRPEPRARKIPLEDDPDALY